MINIWGTIAGFVRFKTIAESSYQNTRHKKTGIPFEIPV